MFVSRFWTLLLALIAGVLLAVVFLAKDQLNREREENATAILFKELDKTDIALNLQARKRLDVLLAVAVDSDIRKILTDVSKDAGKAEKHRQKLLTVLRDRNKELKQYAADMLIAVDMRGDVVVQVGKNQRDHGHNIGGFPVVDSALRGYVRDDMWKIDNEVYMIAARPVINNSRYVGAVVHAMKVSDKFASEISPRVQLGFFAGNLVIAVGTPKKAEGTKLAQGAYIGQPLDTVLADKQFREKGYSEVQKISTTDGDFMAIYSTTRGEAASNDVGFVIVTPIELMANATSFYNQAGTQDIKNLPTGMIITAILLAILFGWGWNYLEAERPVARLMKNIKALETADAKDQLNVYRFRRRMRNVASAINKVMDIKTKAILEAAGSSSKSIDSILGNQEGGRLSSASFKFAEASVDDIPDAPPPPGAAQQKSPPGAPPPPGGGRAPIPPTPPSGSKQPAVPPPAPASAMSPADEIAYFRKTHADFVALKQKLGESVDQLTFERFEVTLKKNRDTLIARYGCKSVTFKVYEKDGKASLKATPVK